MINQLNFNVENLWNGCILASISNAISAAVDTTLVYEHSWDGVNYNVQDSNGTRCTVTFASKNCVVAINDDKNNNKLNITEFFKEVNNDIFKIANEETLQYLLQNVNGIAVPLITTAFWSENSLFFSKHSVEEIKQNGGSILQNQLSNYRIALEYWTEYYDFSKKQLKLLEYLYNEKIANPTKIISLTKKETKLLEYEDEETYKESAASFKEIGILLP